MPSWWPRSISVTRQSRLRERKSGFGLARFMRYEPWVRTRLIPLAASFSRKAAFSSSRSGRQAHCIWLRVKIWMASAPMASPLPGALNTPAVMGTWAPRCMGGRCAASGPERDPPPADLEEERAVLLRDVLEQDLVGGA